MPLGYTSTRFQGNYAEALYNYYEVTQLEIDPHNESYIPNMRLIHTSNEEHTKVLEYYF
ncbi:unnamed protein product, partial [Vitis vinifera]|uniref:Uncharacterized protein n=1 Tax=Vitis vinifera TaxID=29760 RepID=D7SGU9_VITVI